MKDFRLNLFLCTLVTAFVERNNPNLTGLYFAGQVALLLLLVHLFDMLRDRFFPSDRTPTDPS